MTKKVFSIVIIFLLPSILMSCDRGKIKHVVGAQKTRVLIIFSDVTTSLIPEENEKVAGLTCDVLDSLPSGTIYAVYPIQIETQRLSAIKEGKIDVEKNERANQTMKDQRRKELTEEIAKLYKMIRPFREYGDGYGKPDNHTCILNTLSFAEEQLRQYKDRNLYDPELVYISDMVEECNRTPMRRPIDLAKRDISEEIGVAENSGIKLNLSDIPLTIIIPATDQTYTAGPRPDVADLRRFWAQVFRHCGVNPESFEKDERFYFSAGLPKRFKPEVVVSK